MSTKRKTSAKIAQPVVRQSAKKALRPQINQSETTVSVAQPLKASDTDPPEAIIEISSDADSSDYEVSDHEPDHAEADAIPPKATRSATQRSADILQKHNDGTSTDIAMACLLYTSPSPRDRG